MIPTLRAAIWSTSKHDPGVIEKAKQGVKLDPATVHYWEAVLRRVEELMKPKRTKKVPTDQTTQASKDRYRQAKWDYESSKFKPWVQDGHFIEPEYPNAGTANGLTNWIVNYINWTGGNATRVSSEGKAIVKNGEIIRVPSNTRNGTSDAKSTIRGRSVQWEVKAGADRPSSAQLKEQARERAAGGEYFFTHNAEEFFIQYDSLSVQKELFS